MLTQDISKKLSLMALTLIILISELIVLTYALNKFGFHVDELLSFAHSNSTTGAFLYDLSRSGDLKDINDQIYNNWVEPQEFWNYLTVQHSDAFGYSNIMNNLEDSVHPPLYYCILHTISSIFPDTFSKWLGIVPNMLGLAFVLISVFKLSKLLYGSMMKAVFICGLFGFSLACASITVFIRSYLLLTLLTVMLVFQMASFFMVQKFQGPRLVGVFTVALLGLLTHYYFVVFAAFLTFWFCCLLFSQKRYKRLLVIASTMLCSVIVSFLVNSNAWTHIFASTRGEESTMRFGLQRFSIVAFNNLTEVLLRDLFGIQAGELTPTFVWLDQLLRLLVIVLISFVLYRILVNIRSFSVLDTISRYYRKVTDRTERLSTKQVFLKVMLLSVLCTAYVLGMIAPEAAPYNNRYYISLVPLLIILLCGSLFSLILNFKANSIFRIIIPAIVILVVLSAHFTQSNVYVFPDIDHYRSRLRDDLAGTTCLFISTQDYHIHALSDLLYTANNIYSARRLSASNLSKVISVQEDNDDVIIVVKLFKYDHPDFNNKSLDSIAQNTDCQIKHKYSIYDGISSFAVYSVTPN